MAVNSKNVKDDRLVAAGEEFMRRLQKQYPIDIQIATTMTMNNVMKGCPWAFINSKDIEGLLPDLKGSQHVSCFKLMETSRNKDINKYVMLTSMQGIVGVLNKEARGIFSQEDLDHAVSKRNEALNRLAEFMKAGKYGEIGILSLNEGREIIANGISYPAFSITLNDLVSYCVMFKYWFVIDGRKLSPDVITKNIDKVFQSLQVAPSGNALFVKVTR